MRWSAVTTWLKYRISRLEYNHNGEGNIGLYCNLLLSRRISFSIFILRLPPHIILICSFFCKSVRLSYLNKGNLLTYLLTRRLCFTRRLSVCLSVCWQLHLTRSSATAKSTARPSCLVGVLYDISQEKICRWLINHFYVIGHESYRIWRINAK